PNTPADILAGKSQSFYFAITPTQSFSQDIPVVAVCDNTDPAPTVGGLNTFLLSVTNPQSADMLSIAASVTPGSVNLTSTTASGLSQSGSPDEFLRSVKRTMCSFEAVVEGSTCQIFQSKWPRIPGAIASAVRQASRKRGGSARSPVRWGSRSAP